jgi:hypothetical protein
LPQLRQENLSTKAAPESCVSSVGSNPKFA